MLTKEESLETKEEKLQILIEEYASYINRLAYLYVKDWAIAEDITQDVFMKCYEKLDTFRGESS